MDHTNWGDLRSFLADPFQLQEPIRGLWLRRVVTYHGEKAERYVADHWKAGGLREGLFCPLSRVFPEDVKQAREVHGTPRKKGDVKLLDLLARGSSLEWKAPLLLNFTLTPRLFQALGPSEDWAYSDWDQIPEAGEGWRLTDNLRHFNFAQYSALEEVPGWEPHSHLTGEEYPALWDQFTATREGMPQLSSVALSKDWQRLCYHVLEVDRGFVPMMNAPRIQEFHFKRGLNSRGSMLHASPDWCWAQSERPSWPGYFENRPSAMPRPPHWGGPNLAVFEDGNPRTIPGSLMIFIDEGPPPASPADVVPPTPFRVEFRGGSTYPRKGGA